MTPHQYYSESRKQYVDLEDMPSPHLANAMRKVEKRIGEGEKGLSALMMAMNDELVERGCTWNAETQRWTFPEKEPQP